MSHQPSLRVVFAGTPAFAARHLQTLLDSPHRVVAAYTQPDRPAGRGKKISASPVKELALQHQLAICQPDSLKNPAEQQTLAGFNADIMVVVAYGLLLPPAVIDLPRLGCINVHASLLPRWRGAAPIQRAIEAGDKESGVTIMQMDSGLDTGPMLLKKSCEILVDDTSATLHDKLAELGCSALLEVLNKLAASDVVAEAQDDGKATYANKIQKPEAQIDWDLAAAEIQRRIRAFVPFPVAYSELEGRRIKIFSATVVANPEATATPGTIVGINAKTSGGITVACGEQALLIRDMQLPGKPKLAAHQVLLGHRELFAVRKQFHRPNR